MGKIVTVVGGEESQVVFDAGMGGLAQIQEAGYDLSLFYRIPTDHDPAKIIVDKENEPIGHWVVTLAEGEEKLVGNLTGFSFRHIKG